MRQYLKLLSHPFSADIRLKVSDKMLNAMLDEFVPKYDVSIRCMDDYLDIGVMVVIAKIHLQISIKEIIINSTQLKITLSINNKVGNLVLKGLSKLSPLLKIKDNAIEVDLSQQMREALKDQDQEIIDQIDRIQVAEVKISNGFLAIRLNKDEVIL